MDVLTILAAVAVCAVLHAFVETRTPADAPAPRNVDVLAPAPRSQAVRLDNVDAATLRDLQLARRLFGATAGTVVTIRSEVSDGR